MSEIKMIGLNEICLEVDITPKTARQILRDNEIERPGARWQWKEGSKDLKSITAILSSPKTKEDKAPAKKSVTAKKTPAKKADPAKKPPAKKSPARKKKVA